ncbi:GNAT family N-acetyltransferase [Tabrizicola sp.]|uniref:GNAT family N-acetyltransferase n=1 Tax=Tabrizicola sp. TaxID=2005166 RepID=UPI003F33DC88
MIPTLTTARLTLRAPVMADFPAYREFVTSDRTRFMGGPHGAATAWNWFCNDSAQWSLLDMGALIITLEGHPIGQVAVCHGPIFPEPELGWFLFAGSEGHGYAFEAATAMRDWAFGPRGLPTLVSYVHADNLASARLARRIGGVIDPKADTPAGMTTDAYRHRRAA